MRALIVLGTLGLLLAGCAAPVPDSGTGVGFTDYSQYELQRAQREAALTGAPSGTLPGATYPTTGAIPPGGIPASDLAAAGIGVAPVTTGPIGVPLNSTALGAVPTTGGQDLNRSTGVQASPGNAAPVLVTGDAGISNSQDFAAVSGATTIESAALARQQAAAQYQVVQPTALPDAPASTGPDIVAYALNAPNRKGQEWYSRFMLGGGLGRFERNCASYRSPDEAQRDFLANGGPERDSRGVDPDGDGFACGWDPSPFLAAVGRN